MLAVVVSEAQVGVDFSCEELPISVLRRSFSLVCVAQALYNTVFYGNLRVYHLFELCV